MARWAASVAVLVCVAGCRLLSNNDDEAAPAPAAQTAAATAEPTVNAASGEVTGIPECDALLVAFECYMKNSGVPDYQMSIKAMRDGFRQSAANPSGRQTTASACKMQMSAQQANFARVGCSGGSGAPAPPGGGNLQ